MSLSNLTNYSYTHCTNVFFVFFNAFNANAFLQVFKNAMFTCLPKRASECHLMYFMFFITTFRSFPETAVALVNDKD